MCIFLSWPFVRLQDLHRQDTSGSVRRVPSRHRTIAEIISARPGRRRVLPPSHRTGEAASFASPTSLFRQEVVDFKEIERQFGRAILLQPISLKVITWFLATLVALSLSLLVIGQYSRKATVNGYLIPASGTAKIFALQRGTITKVEVTEGEEVREQQPLLTIDTTQISATGEDVNAAILRTLLGQRQELNNQVTGEARREASERERLTRLTEGLKNQVDQLDAQIPLQQDRIKISESLVASISELVAKGVATE